MSYATTQEMLNRYGTAELVQLTDPPERTGSINTQRLTESIEAANAMVDAYLSGGGYNTPLVGASEAVIDAACIIARYKLYRYEVPDTVVFAKDEAINFLEKVAKGTLSLNVQSENESGIAAPVRQMMFSGTAVEVAYARTLDHD
ncbi:MAG: DUF1320 domain-containing protein [Gammaproteobacteria bacterium]|jgi:phage gp36-like protein|nr:DUF1320 domain-containing protein [Gammaproteobacteria bacterium]